MAEMITNLLQAQPRLLRVERGTVADHEPQMLGPSMEENQHAEYLMAAVASLSLVGTARWANVYGPAMPSQTGPNFRAVTRTIGHVWTWPIDKEARSPVQTKTKGRAAHVGGSRKSAMLERSADLGDL
jgi:hypothetical protein